LRGRAVSQGNDSCVTENIHATPSRYKVVPYKF
jgi:hypothetical protein